MEVVLVGRILSGLPDNVVDVQKAYNYGVQMAKNDLLIGETGFPPILGYWGEAGEEHFGLTTGLYVTGGVDERVISEEDIGKPFFFVTDGHHRVMGAKMHGVGMVQYEIDQSKYITHDNK